jgi:hypothetical protein
MVEIECYPISPLIITTYAVTWSLIQVGRIVAMGVLVIVII